MFTYVCKHACVCVTRAENTSGCPFYLGKLECGHAFIKPLLNTLYTKDTTVGIKKYKNEVISQNLFSMSL